MRIHLRSVVTRVALVALLALVAVLGAGCGGGGSKANVEDEIGLDPEGIVARQARIEVIIRDCMKAQGFEYVPVDPVAVRTGLTGQSDFNEDEFEKAYGYGITTLYEQRRNPPADPNAAIRNALSPADQTAYTQALYGQYSDATFAVVADTGEFGRLGGCTKQATEQAFGGADVLQSVIAKLDELDERIVTDPRMQKAIAAWSDCMTAVGYDLANPEQVDVFLQRRLDAIVGPVDSPKATYDAAALKTLQQDEVAMVTADKECDRKHIEKVEGDVRAEYETTFREQNADLLGKVTKL